MPRRNPPRNRRPPKRLINVRPGHVRLDWQKKRSFPDLPDNISDEGEVIPYSGDEDTSSEEEDKSNFYLLNFVLIAGLNSSQEAFRPY